MNTVQKVASLVATGIGIAAGAYFGYKILSDSDRRDRIVRSVADVFETSRKKAKVMSEDIALRTAQMTKNQKVNQDWVAQQWESVGY
ncbi:hypothetical protein [Enorma burkinafasonensis]|uniref:hypothetical protein n=1 Tax=Enorma burkinafasonensis TaxID=2590867 RepID=UPI0026F1BDCE|nr:hypothetical protein [Enorma burkinafasonensis]MCI7731130.1 hypothetical protein [Enorma burkinafasonensis]